MTQILIDSAPDGYTIEYRADDGTIKVFTGGIASMHVALDHAFMLAGEIEKATGQHIEPLVSAAAIRDNRKRDTAARKLWNNPDFRVTK